MSLPASIFNALTAYTIPYKGLPREAWLISAAVFINRIGSSVIYFLALYLNQTLGKDAIATGWTLAIWGFGSVIGSFLGGFLCDRIGKKNVLVFGHLLSGSAYLSLLLTHDYSVITSIVFFAGLADFSLRPALHVAMIGATDQTTRARGNALRRIALNTGVSIGAALGGILFSVDPSLLFWLDGMTSFAGAFMFWKILPADRAARTAQPLPSTLSQQLSPWIDQVFGFILIGDMIVAYITSQQRNVFPLYLSDHYHLDSHYFGLLLSVNCLVIVFLELPLVHRLRKHRYVFLCITGSLCYGIGFGLLPFGTSAYWVWLSWTTFTLGEMLWSPASMAMVQDRAARSANPGSYMGLFTASYSVMGLFGPLAGGWLYVSGGGWSIWPSCFLAGILCSFLFYWLARRGRL